MPKTRYKLYKVFNWKDVPSDLIDSFNIKPGHSMMFHVLDNEIGDWFVEHGAQKEESIFIFRD